MPDYTIANIPTFYRGRLYRSRLEARWAAFFDRLGWTYEYEPFDLGRWSPDFVITAPFDALVEVKPATEWDKTTASKMASAVTGTPLLLMIRVSPLVRKTRHMIGWVGVMQYETYCFPEVGLIWRPHGHAPGMYADLCWVLGEEVHTATGPDAWRHGDGWRFYQEHVEALWSDACNAVQWEPEQ